MIEIKPKVIEQVDDYIDRLLTASDDLATISKAGARYAKRMSSRLCESHRVESHDALLDIDFADEDKAAFVDKVWLLLKLEVIETAYAEAFQRLFSTEEGEE